MLKRAIIQYGKEWDELLAITELCYNPSPHESSEFAPHEIVYGMATAIPLLKI